MAVFLPYSRRRLIKGQFFGGEAGGGGESGPRFEDPYGQGTEGGEGPFRFEDPYGQGTEGGEGPVFSGPNFGPMGPSPEQNPGYPTIQPGRLPMAGGAGNPNRDDEYDPAYDPTGGYSPPGGARGGYGDLSFQAGLGVSALSGLFTALGGILSAQEAGRQLRKQKQTPANRPGDIARTASGFSDRRSRPQKSSSQYAPPMPPMLGNPSAGANRQAAQLKAKMENLLAQVGSTQLKASRFGVGGF